MNVQYDRHWALDRNSVYFIARSSYTVCLLTVSISLFSAGSGYPSWRPPICSSVCVVPRDCVYTYIYILFVYMYVGIYNTEIAVLTCNVKRVKKAIVFLRISGKIQKYILYMVASCAKPARLAVPSRGANSYEYNILIVHRKPIYGSA